MVNNFISLVKVLLVLEIILRKNSGNSWEEALKSTIP